MSAVGNVVGRASPKAYTCKHVHLCNSYRLSVALGEMQLNMKLKTRTQN